MAKVILAKIVFMSLALSLVGCDSSDEGDSGENGTVGVSEAAQIVPGNQFTVSGLANIYAAQRSELPDFSGGAGELPPTYNFDAGPGKILTIVTSSGFADCCSSSSPLDPPDGSSGGTSLEDFEDISGIFHPSRRMFVSGVFTNGRNTDNPAPEIIDYNGIDTETTVEFFPLQSQIFYIGDGLTGNGSTQSFFVPQTATSVSFGVADGFNFNGRPSFYGDNTGAWQLIIRLE